MYHNNNINTTNKYNNKLFYNNQYRWGCEKRGSVDKSCENSTAVDALDSVAEEDGAVEENSTHLIQHVKFPSFAADCMNGKSFASEAASKSANEDNAILAALYNKTHGGSFYHFTLSNNHNQPYVEDI